MGMMRILLAMFVVSIVPAVSFAQTNEQPNDQRCLDPNVRRPRGTISFGALNSRGIDIPKPVYPALAKSARVSGSVVTHVVIDETGDVIWARIVSGHPLLRGSVAKVVCEARVKPIRLARRFVKVNGVIVYNFVL